MEELGHVIVKGIPKWLLFSIFTRVINLKLLLLHIQLSSTPSSLSNGKDKLDMFDLPVCLSFIFFFLISGPVATKHRPEVLQHFNGNDRTERKPYPNKDYPGIWYIYIYIICLSYMKHSKLSLCKRLFFFPFLLL